MKEKSFEELFKESLSESKFDKTVTGTIIAISSKGEIFVDFGYKADGIIPLKEYSDIENENPKNEFKAGDIITADIIKWNDGSGNVLLSYKRTKNREKVKLEKERKIKEAEEREQRKIERANSIKEFWDKIKIGNKYIGTISKIENFGLFIDLGNVNGLLHISEIVWNRDEKLQDKFNVGEQIEVIVKDFNKDENKISLIYPGKGENPWFKLADKYNINDIVTCKVVKFAPFGAFVEIEKNLEGLVHNSQITSLKRITKPEETLKIGQIVNAKILNIDKENCKISLTIKELEGTSKEFGYEEYIKGENKNE